MLRRSFFGLSSFGILPLLGFRKSELGEDFEEIWQRVVVMYNKFIPRPPMEIHVSIEFSTKMNDEYLLIQNTKSRIWFNPVMRAYYPLCIDRKLSKSEINELVKRFIALNQRN